MRSVFEIENLGILIKDVLVVAIVELKVKCVTPMCENLRQKLIVDIIV